MTEEPDGFGAWYDAKQADTGDPWHRTLIDPGLFARLGPLGPGTRVLDVGCGNGYIARRLARGGARVVGIDASAELVERARARESEAPLGITYLHGDAAAPIGWPDASFDVAVANMSLMDIEAAEKVVDEVARLVVDHGRFVFSISHPCFDVDNRSAWDVETTAAATTVYRRITDYRRPHSDRYRWELGPGHTATTAGFHRPLSWYAHVLRRAGWTILDLEEPAPTAEFVGRRIEKAWLEEVPLHLVVEARREPRSRRADAGPPSSAAGRA